MPLKKFLINRSSDRKFRLNGIIPSSRLPSTHNLRLRFSHHVIYQSNDLPAKTDLRSYMTPVEDQSQIGSCTANSMAGAYEYLTKRKNGQDIDISRLFIYYNGRIIQAGDENAEVSDTGCSMTDVIEAVEKYGTCLESIWPYDISMVNTRPNDDAYDAAKDHKITESLQVNVDLNEMKSCLAQGFPFLFGLKLYSSFDMAAKNGIVPMPSSNDGSRQSDGNHALLAVGYSDQSKSFIVRNSWGTNWGDNGYCYIPYDYMADPEYCFDVWTVRKVATNDFGQDHWDQDDSINYQDNNNSDDNDERSIEELGNDDDNY